MVGKILPKFCHILPLKPPRLGISHRHGQLKPHGTGPGLLRLREVVAMHGGQEKHHAVPDKKNLGAKIRSLEI